MSGKRHAVKLLSFRSLLLGGVLLFSFLSVFFHYQVSSVQENPVALVAFHHTPDVYEMWSFPGLFHFSNATIIEGAIAVQQYQRTGLFNFQNGKDWEILTSTRFRYKLGCEWCLHRDEINCHRGALIVNRPFEFNKIWKNQAAIVRNRFYSQNSTFYYTQYSTLHLRCSLDSGTVQEISQREGVPGFLRILPFSSTQFAARVSKLLPRPKDEEENEDVMCSRGMFGGLRPDALFRFADFYLNRWKFSRVIVYDVGMTTTGFFPERYPNLWELIQSKRLVVVDLKSQLNEWYGMQFQQVALLSGGVFQLMLKIDCLARAKSANARWTFHLDFDEFLFESSRRFTLPSAFPSIHHYLLSQGYLKNSPLLLDFAVQTVNPGVSKICQCKQHSLLDFAQEEHQLHQKEAKLFTNVLGDNLGKNGKRKVLVRLDSPQYEMDISFLGIHIMRKCAFQSRVGGNCKEIGVEKNVDPYRELYLREFSCQNHPLCVGAPKTRLEWFS